MAAYGITKSLKYIFMVVFQRTLKTFIPNSNLTCVMFNDLYWLGHETWTKESITLMSHESHEVSNHWQLHCLLISLSRQTTKETSRICIIGLLWRESTHDWWIPLTKGPVMRKMFPCHYIILEHGWINHNFLRYHNKNHMHDSLWPKDTIWQWFTMQ